MPFDKNDTNSNNHIQATNNNNFLQITDININDDQEKNYINSKFQIPILNIKTI